MGAFRTLIAWQLAMELADDVYQAVEPFPKSELFVLSQQMRAAALSIPSLIAEGRGRYTPADQRHFYREARGSNYELQTQIEFAMRRQLVVPEQGHQLLRKAERVGRLINGLLNKMNRAPLFPRPKAPRPKAQ